MEDTRKPDGKEIDLGPITLHVYNYIANWHNDDFDTPKKRGDNLKIISHQIVKEVLETAFDSIGLAHNYEIQRGGVNIQEVKDMSPEELEKHEEEEKLKKIAELLKKS